MNILKSITLVAILCSTTPALAFDDNRQGFILGLGAGLHSIDIDFVLNGSTILSQSKSGLATSFKIGGGITNQFALYYVRNASWYSAPLFNQDANYVIGMSGLGASYYLSPTAPSGYFLAAFGIGDRIAPFESNVTPDTGSAFMFGGGYEINKHLMVEATVLATNLESANNSSLSIESSSFQVTLNYLFY